MEYEELLKLIQAQLAACATMMDGENYAAWDDDEKWQFMMQLEDAISSGILGLSLPFEPGFGEKGFPRHVVEPEQMAEALLELHTLPLKKGGLK